MDTFMECRNYNYNLQPEVIQSENGRLMLISKCHICNNKKLRFPKINKQKEWLVS